MEHPNLGSRRLQNAKHNQTPSQRPHLGAVPSFMLGCRNPLQVQKAPPRCLPSSMLGHKILSRCKKLKYALDPRPNTEVRLVRGLSSRRAISASPETSPPKPLTVHRISTSFEAPRPRPPARPQREGKLRLVRDTPRQTGTATLPLDGPAHLLRNHPVAWCGCQAASAATPHSGHGRSPVRQLRSLCHHSGAVRT